jgi:RNA polymerase sigma factor (sigma-70 family)
MDSRLYSEIGAAVKYAEENGGDLTTKNLFYVAKVAKDLSAKTGADFDMLFSEGVIAMKKVEEKYDPEKNDSFVKFAGVSVRGYMLNAINRQGTLVHIPVNHQKGFKKGKAAESDAASVRMIDIDAFNYDTLGSVDGMAFFNERMDILQEGLATLDYNSQIALKMKLRLDEYGDMIPSKDDPSKMVYKYQNNMKAIAEMLEVPVPHASKIYNDALKKISAYCQSQEN